LLNYVGAGVTRFVGALITSNVVANIAHTGVPTVLGRSGAASGAGVHASAAATGYQDDDIAPLLAFPADTALSTMNYSTAAYWSVFPT